MKKSLKVLMAAIISVSMLAGCNSGGKTSDVASGSSNQSAASSAAKGLSETGVLNLAWESSVGTDSIFECPWADMQSLYPRWYLTHLLRST